MKTASKKYQVVTITLNPAIDRTVTIPNFHGRRGQSRRKSSFQPGRKRGQRRFRAGRPGTRRGRDRTDYETVLESGYRIQLTKFAFLQPDVQWIIRPSGTGRIPNALVIGAEMGITF